jgi:hypothetical protein
VILGLVDGSCLLEQLGDLGLEVGVGAVGRRRVGLDLGAVQGDQTQADQAGGRAQLQRLDQQPGQGLFAADPEPSDGHMIRRAVAGQDPEGDVLVAAALDLVGGADPGAVAIQQHGQQHPRLVSGPAVPIGPIGLEERAKVELVDHIEHEPGQVVGWQPVAHIRWEYPPEASSFDICNGQQGTDLAFPDTCELEIQIEGDFVPPPEG